MFEDIPVEVGLVHEGERIRKEEMRVELGGPKVSEKFELVLVKKPDEITDGKVTIIGPDLSDLEEGKSYQFGILVEVAGEKLEEDLEGVLERRIHEYLNYIQGVMHLNQRYDLWVRVGKRSYAKGLTSFRQIGSVLISLYRSELPIIQKIQITFFTGGRSFIRHIRVHGSGMKNVMHGHGDCSMKRWTPFTGVPSVSLLPIPYLCDNPQRYANCGAISWFDGRCGQNGS
jgi:acetyl-CoA decarbonylase/synthase complex subunit beta